MHSKSFALLLSIATCGCGKFAPPSTGPAEAGTKGSAPGAPVADGDLKLLQGEWKVLSLERGKSKLEYGKEALSNVLSIEGDLFHRKWLGRAGVMRAALDSSKSPKAIDLTFLDPEGNVAQTYLTHPDGRVEVQDGRVNGIYELRGDNLKICFPDTKKTPRPLDFRSGSEPPDRSVLTLRRIR